MSRLSRLARLALAAALATPAALALTLAPTRADAFCGFYVGGAGAKMFNDATVVVMMREGTRTVLAMQNAYKGPPEKFAMVVPVPVVLQEENVKTLKPELFEHVDQLASPRLVEYWEQDPCAVEAEADFAARPTARAAAPAAAAKGGSAEDLGVTIEAQFTVGEYQIVILSAQDSGGLETWLHRESYTIPEDAEPYFRPYVQAGSKFFVAKVDVSKVKIVDGQAALSPLRFHYDSEEFKLPVRLGLINSSGTQDLIVHVLGRGTRYEVANYPNVTIPTNLDVSEAASGNFGTFYTTLFDRTLEKNPKAVVTEYAWEPTSCDPCPGPALNWNDLTSLGLDALPSSQPAEAPPSPLSPVPVPVPVPVPGAKDAGITGAKPSLAPGRGAPPTIAPSMPRRRFNPWQGGSFVLTRLHVRYTKESLGEDLVFKTAPAIVGGREVMGKDGKLENAAQQSSYNNFQARYAVRHPWTGPIDCKEPKRGRWGGKPGDTRDPFAPPPVKAAQKLGLVKRAKADLSEFVKGDIPEIGFTRGSSASGASGTSGAGGAATSGGATSGGKGCLGCAITETGNAESAAWLAAIAAGVVLAARRRARARARRADRADGVDHPDHADRAD